MSVSLIETLNTQFIHFEQNQQVTPKHPHTKAHQRLSQVFIAS
jgi:hypothetical protein